MVQKFNFCLVFKGTCLKQKSATCTLPNRINFFIIYELDIWLRDLNSEFTLKDCLFGGVKLTKNPDPDKYMYSGYGIGFDSRLLLSLPIFDWGKNVTIFAVDLS